MTLASPAHELRTPPVDGVVRIVLSAVEPDTMSPPGRLVRVGGQLLAVQVLVEHRPTGKPRRIPAPPAEPSVWLRFWRWFWSL
ncbi:MAG TPA: hypothetical protein VFT74_19245 [Isosphaeraceae bacterium]|nr:hypothetical protein [Isosphaeraceae bacterium]